MKKLTEVDWSKAPEGATHYNAECTCPWLKETPPSYFDHWDWIEYGPHAYENHFSRAIKRPQEWDGSGVPPVGTICEYLSKSGVSWGWGKCEVVAYYYANVVVVDVLDNTADLVQPIMIRPIKTLEQLVEEERENVIADMYETVIKGVNIKYGVAALYNAGYRKTEVNNDQIGFHKKRAKVRQGDLRITRQTNDRQC